MSGVDRSGIVLLGLVMISTAGAQDSFDEQIRPAPQPQVTQPVAPAPPAVTPGPAAGSGNAQPVPDPGGSGGGQSPDFSRVAALESRDYGVAATAALHTGPMHGPTPISIPGGQVISTEALYGMMQQNPNGFLLLDVLGSGEYLPQAQAAVPAAAPGSFNDQTQQQFGQYLSQTTGGNKATPLVLYCQSTQCWMSYNAALRAVNLGYTRVLWYRGGLEAWQAAGLPVQSGGY